MDFLWTLFSFRQHRHYARVDQDGICRAFKHCIKPPAGHDWVEINESRLCWLNQPLPATARVVRAPARSRRRPLLTA